MWVLRRGLSEKKRERGGKQYSSPFNHSHPQENKKNHVRKTKEKSSITKKGKKHAKVRTGGVLFFTSLFSTFPFFFSIGHPPLLSIFSFPRVSSPLFSFAAPSYLLFFAFFFFQISPFASFCFLLTFFLLFQVGKKQRKRKRKN